VEDPRGYSLTEEMDEAENIKFEDLMALEEGNRVKMVELFKRTLREEDIAFFKKIIKDNPDGEWATTISNATPMPFHFGGGMAVRNFFRTEGFDEKELGINNLDNVYVSIIEQAINSLPEDYSTKKSFFSKIKSFF